MLAGNPSMSLGGGGAEIRGWGGGGAKDGLDLGNMENQLGLLKLLGSFELHVTGLSNLAIINGPTNVGPSLCEGSLKLMSLDNQTF